MSIWIGKAGHAEISGRMTSAVAASEVVSCVALRGVLAISFSTSREKSISVAVTCLVATCGRGCATTSTAG